MSRYIDAEKIKYTEYINGDVTVSKDLVEKIPTADVVEVKHGEWIEDRYENATCVCSCCGAEAQYVSKFNETFGYDWEENLQPTGYEEIREYILAER